MGNEFIRFALTYYTDWAKFESLATEMMRDRGYADIKPLGGQKDGGRDAVVERYFSHAGKRTRTIFQFTLRKDVLTKILETIKTLIASKEDFVKLMSPSGMVEIPRLAGEGKDSVM